MIVSVLRAFINSCDRIEITPDEAYINKYLEAVNCPEYKIAFIKFCHYSWEERNLIEDLEELLFISLSKIE